MPVVGLVHGEPGERHLEPHVVVERHEPFRQTGVVGMVDQRLSPPVLLDVAGASQQRLEIAVLGNELCRRLHPDARYARNVVGGIPDQRLHLDDLARWHPEFLDHLRDADLAILHGVVHDDAIGHELHQVLVGGDDGRGRARLAGLAHVGGDQVVRLEAGLLQARQVEGAHRGADQRKLGTQVIGRVGSVCLVVRIHVGPECLLRLVEHDRQVARPLVRFHVAHQLPQHVAEAEHGVDLQPVGFARQWRQRVIGAEYVGGAVDQKDVIATLRRPGLDGCGGFGARGGFGGHAPDLTLPTRFRHPSVRRGRRCLLLNLIKYRARDRIRAVLTT